MLRQMTQVYLQNTQTYSQYLDYNSLVSTFKSWIERNIGKEHINYQKILQEKISEIFVKIKNSDTEQTTKYIFKFKLDTIYWSRRYFALCNTWYCIE